MEEQKLATMLCIVCGKEIDKNYARNTIGNYCKRCAVDRALKIQIDKDYASGAMDENIIFDVEEAVKNNQDASCYVGDLLRIIKRLQGENEKQREEIERLKEVNAGLALANLCDLPPNEDCLTDNEFEVARKTITEQKAEIERLKEEKAELKMEIATQKLKYEALKTGTNIVNGFNEAFKSVRETEIRQQAEKDTAKEIFTDIGKLCNELFNGKILTQEFMAKYAELMKRYGVEGE